MILLYITIFIFIILTSFGKKGTILNNKYNNNALLFLLFIIISISIYHIEIHSVPDLKNYLRRFNYLSTLDLNLLIGYIKLTEEPAFDILQWVGAKSTGSFKFFVVIVWSVIFLNLYRALKNLFDSSNVLFVMVSYFSFFIFFSYVLNVMRQGLAISFLFVAISLLVTNKKTMTFYISIMLAPLFHITSLPISIVLLYFKWFNLKLRTALSLWVISIGLFVTNLNTKIFSRLEYSLLETYTSESVYERYSAVNRLDFLLFSILFTCLFLFLYNYTEDKATYNILIKLYLILNTYFLLLGFIAFNDRIAAYSWMLIPLILFKSIPNSTNERYKVTLLTLAFLLSMIFTGSMDVVIRAF